MAALPGAVPDGYPASALRADIRPRGREAARDLDLTEALALACADRPGPGCHPSQPLVQRRLRRALEVRADLVVRRVGVHHLVARLQEADLWLDAHRGSDTLGQCADLVRRVRANVEDLAVGRLAEGSLGDDGGDVAGV